MFLSAPGAAMTNFYEQRKWILTDFLAFTWILIIGHTHLESHPLFKILGLPLCQILTLCIGMVVLVLFFLLFGAFNPVAVLNVENIG